MGCTQTPTVQTTCNGMSIEAAMELVLVSDCAQEGTLTDSYVCNENTNTWWIDITVPDAEGCNPACVVNIETQIVEINWRCTGLLPPTDGEVNLSEGDLDTLIQDLEDMSFDDLAGLSEE